MEYQREAVPKEFYDRADAIIELANDQLADESRGKVSASTLYAAARFNAFITACLYSSADEMKEGLAGTIEYLVEEYRKMLKDNLDDHVANFSKYIK